MSKLKKPFLLKGHETVLNLNLKNICEGYLHSNLIFFLNLCILQKSKKVKGINH